MIVRGCAFGEYLVPGTFDACNPCESGTFNLIPTDTECKICPESTTCTAVANAVASFNARHLASDLCGCSTVEQPGDMLPESSFLVPEDGMWHSNSFSGNVSAAMP